MYSAAGVIKYGERTERERKQSVLRAWTPRFPVMVGLDQYSSVRWKLAIVQV